MAHKPISVIVPVALAGLPTTSARSHLYCIIEMLGHNRNEFDHNVSNDNIIV
jgi:hypothetical protein